MKVFLGFLLTIHTLFSVEHGNESTSLLSTYDVSTAKEFFTQEWFWSFDRSTKLVKDETERFVRTIKTPTLLESFNQHREECIPQAREVYQNLKDSEYRGNALSKKLIGISSVIGACTLGESLWFFLSPREDLGEGVTRNTQIMCGSLAASCSAVAFACAAFTYIDARKHINLLNNAREALQNFSLQTGFELEPQNEAV